MFTSKHTVVRLTGGIAVAASLAALTVPSALSKTSAYHDDWYNYAISLTKSAKTAPFITDTLAPGGKPAPVQGYRFITDTLAPGGSTSLYHRWFLIEHSPSAATRPQGYRFITDTLAPGGGTSVAPAPASSGFDWGDAGVGAGATAGVMLALLGSLRLTQRRKAIAV